MDAMVTQLLSTTGMDERPTFFNLPQPGVPSPIANTPISTSRAPLSPKGVENAENTSGQPSFDQDQDDLILLCDRDHVIRPPSRTVRPASQPDARGGRRLESRFGRRPRPDVVGGMDPGLPSPQYSPVRVPAPAPESFSPAPRPYMVPEVMENLLSDGESDGETEYIYRGDDMRAWGGFNPYTLSAGHGQAPSLTPNGTRRADSPDPEPEPDHHGTGPPVQWGGDTDWMNFSLEGAVLPRIPSVSPTRARPGPDETPARSTTPAAVRFARLETIRSAARERLYRHLEEGRAQEEHAAEERLRERERLAQVRASAPRVDVRRGRRLALDVG